MGVEVYVSVCVHARSHTHTARGVLSIEPRGLDETLGGPKESEWTIYVCVHVYKVHMCIQ